MGGSGRVLLVGLAAVYCFASASEVLFVKGLNAQGIEFPVLTSALLNSYWPLQLAMYVALARRATNYRRLTWPIVRGYMVIGVLATAVSLLRCYGLNGLPGSTYVVLSCSDIVFNTLLSRFALKTRFTLYHYSAVLITVVGILLLGMSEEAAAPQTSSKSEAGAPSVSVSVAVVSSLGSALLSAVNSVLSEFLLSKDKSNPLVSVSEVSFFNSFVPSLVLPVAMHFTGELALYEQKFSAVQAAPGVLAIVAGLALGL